jgi:hypothetical protein
MYSYHIVAELRQIRGARLSRDHCVPQRNARAGAGTVSPRNGLTCMDKFFLALMVSAVLLLIAAAGLMVNSGSMREPTAEVARVLRAPGPVR